MNKRTFYKNTAVMTGCSLALRFLGIAFRIAVSNRVGAEGMGLYQLVFSIYVLGSTFATGGLVTAVTRLVGEQLVKGDHTGVRKLMKTCAVLCLAVGGLSSLLLYLGAPFISNWIGDERSCSAIAICGVALPFIGISSCLKGYFMARRKAWPPCIAQILEQIIRIGVILLLLNSTWDGTIQHACTIIILGDALSETSSCLYLLITYRWDRKQPTAAAKTTSLAPLKPLLHIALPLTAGRYLTTGLRTAESVLVPNRLSLYSGSESLALAEFGAVKGMALPLIFFPSALLMTLSGLLVPELSDAYALKQRRQVARLVERTLHITLLGAIPLGALFTLLGNPLGDLLYHEPMVGRILQVLGPLTPFMYLDSVVSGMLKGTGQQMHTLWYTVTDSALRILLIWCLLPYGGLSGFLLVMVISNLLTCLLGTSRLVSVSGATFLWGRWVLLPTLAATLAAMACIPLPLNGVAYLAASLLLFTGVYGGLIGLFGCFTKADWQEFMVRKGKIKSTVD